MGTFRRRWWVSIPDAEGSETVDMRDPSAERIRREARVAGIRDPSVPTLEIVERRRLQLWALTVFLLLAVSAGVALVSTTRPAPEAEGVTPAVMRISLVLISIGFGIYAIEKELHLRRLVRLLADQEVLTTTLTNQLGEMTLLLEAGKAMNSELELPSVLETILRTALELLEGAGGSIMLLRETEEMVTVLARGDGSSAGERVRVGSGIAGGVASTREALLIEGSPDTTEPPLGSGGGRDSISVVCVPLVARNVLFGVLSVQAAADRRFTEYDLQAASLLAEQAAGALANARRYEIERMHRHLAEQPA